MTGRVLENTAATTIKWLLLVLGLFSSSMTENEFEDKGNACREHWTDGSSVKMGCLLFDSSVGLS